MTLKRIPTFCIVIMCLAIACSPGKKSGAGTSTTSATSSKDVAGDNDGSSFEKAIIIKEQNETAGIRAEYKWLKKHYPGYKTKSQSLTQYDKKPYDILTIETADGDEKKVYFDISRFFGKF